MRNPTYAAYTFNSHLLRYKYLVLAYSEVMRYNSQEEELENTKCEMSYQMSWIKERQITQLSKEKRQKIQLSKEERQIIQLSKEK